MRVTITTEGGFTGRGIGSASGEVDDALLAGANEWRDSYDASGADLIRYTLTFGTRRVSWSEGADIPRDLAELFARVWRH